MSSCKSLIRTAIIGMAALFVFTGVGQAPAQEMMRRDSGGMMRGDDRHGSGMRGVGIGTGIGVGIGIGRAIADQPAPGPEERRVSTKKGKKTKTVSTKPRAVTRKPEDVSLTFQGKPADVAHNPSHTDGDMGKLSEHKSVLVTRDGEYARRNYYSASKGDDTKWYWYETRVSREDPVVSKIPYVASCGRDNDTCTVITRDIPPIGLDITDIFGDWWTGYKPVKVVPRCDAVTRTVPGSIPQVTIASCNNVAGSCSGTCELFNAAGASVGPSPPATLNVAAGAASVSGVSCKCPQ